MATANPLEDILNSEVDESAVNALVGSLESQLASPTIRVSSQQATTSSVIVNHVGGVNIQVPVTSGLGNAIHTLAPQPGKIFMRTTNSETLQLNAPNDNKNALVQPQQVGVNSVVTGGITRLPLAASTTVAATVSAVKPNATLVNTRPSIQTQPNITSVTLNNGTPLTVSVQQNATIAHQPVTIAIGSTNTGTVVLGSTPNSVPISVISNVGTNGNPLQTAASLPDRKPVVFASSVDAKPPLGLPGLVTTMKQEPENKPQVVYSVINKPSSAVKTEVKSEVKFVATRPANAGNALVSGANLKTGTASPNTNVITINKPAVSTQTVTVMRPSVATPSAASNSIQIVTMNNAVVPRPSPAVTTTHKTLAPRVQVGTPVRIAAQPQVVPTVRQQGNVNAITIPQNMFPPGSYLVRNDQGQVVVVPGSTAGSSTPQQTIRLHRPSTPGATTVTTVNQTQRAPISVSPAPSPAVIRPPTTTTMTLNRVSVAATVSSAPVNNTTSAPSQPTTIQTTSQQAAALQQATAQKKQDDLENMRKCKNFLSTLLRLAASQPASTVKNVQALIQGLIDGKVDPEHFTQQLQVELKSNPQPYLVPFLRKSLPLLRMSMMSGKMRIDGINAPAVRQAGLVQQPGIVGPNRGLVATSTALRPPIQPYQIIPSQGGSKPTVIPRGIQPNNIRPQVLSQATSATAAAVLAAGNKHLQPGLIRTSQPANRTSQSSKPTTSRPPIPHPKAVSPAASRDKRKYDSLKDDDDINDVAAMGGVNLSEESRNILASSSDHMAGQLRSCKDQVFLHSQPLVSKLKAAALKHGLDDVSPEAATLISHAVEARLRTVLEKLSLLAEHRLEVHKMDKRLEVSREVRPQLKFLEEVDREEKKRHEDAERETLLRAAKSRSKQEDPEQQKLKLKAKAMQQAEMEEIRQREANLTALAAIGPRKKRKVDANDGQGGSPGSNTSASGSSTPRTVSLRPRIKRVNLRDLLFVLEQEREMTKSNLLYKTFLK